MAWDDASSRVALRTLFDAAVAAADPRHVLAAHLPDKPRGRCVVVGGGKSAALMALALEDAWPDVSLEGTVVTRYGHAVPTRSIEVIEAAHPVPDGNSERGARRLLERVGGLGPDDLVLALMSGGASALLTLPAPGLSLADKQAVNRDLLACGARIGEMNCVRKHLSGIKGGRLAAAAAPARVGARGHPAGERPLWPPARLPRSVARRWPATGARRGVREWCRAPPRPPPSHGPT